MNFSQFLEMKARGSPEALALVDSRNRLTYAELDSLACRFANALVARGLGPGDRMAVFLPNRSELVIAFFGALKAGVIAVPLNWRLVQADLAKVLSHCNPGCVVSDAAQRDKLAGVAPDKLLLVEDGARQGSFWQALDEQGGHFATLPRQADDVANLLYTSGTTSTPKAAIHTHGMRVAIGAAMADCFRLSSRDVGLAISPIYHTAGMSVMCNAIFAGAALVLLERWDVHEFVAAIRRESVTFLHVIGTVVVDIVGAPAAIFHDIGGSVRFSWGGGHSLDPESFREYERRVGGVMLQGYSRTEGGLAYNPLDAARRRFDMHGWPNRNSAELAVIDPATGREVAVGQEGEIVFRGDGVSPGYWEEEGLRVPKRYPGGWFATGDNGFVDPDGGLHFLGRRDHMIKSGGENVYPAEVESVVLKVAGVADAVVLGLPDPRLGQRVAVLVVRQDPTLDAARLEQACRAQLAGFKVPRKIGFAEALPRLGSQKVDLAACRALLASQA